MLERAIIDHASPTLARLKLGNLFNHAMGTDFLAEFATLGRELEDKGVTMTILKAVNGKALIYIYRSADLEKVLMCEDVRQLLSACGYSRFDVSGVLDTLKARLNDIDTFPHEIGVFLGYPLEDVKGFIENCGRQCKLCGMWKVYGDVERAKEMFERYDQCRIYLCRELEKGKQLRSCVA